MNNSLRRRSIEILGSTVASEADDHLEIGRSELDSLRSTSRLLRTNRLFQIGAVIAVGSIVLAAIGPLVAPYPLTTATSNIDLPPSATHWFGTDGNGFDVFSRVIAAPRIDVAIAVSATLLSLTFGCAIGLACGYARGWLSEAVMRVVDMAQAFPLFVFAIVIVVMSGRNIWTIVLVAALLNAPIYIRLMYGQVVSLRERAFVEASRAVGNSEFDTALRYVLPNALPPVFAQVPVTLGYTILITAGLSFIGAGVRPPTAEWGSMIASGTSGLTLGQWWTSVFPGVAISLTVFGFAALGEGMRHARLGAQRS